MYKFINSHKIGLDYLSKYDARLIEEPTKEIKLEYPNSNKYIKYKDLQFINFDMIFQLYYNLFHIRLNDNNNKIHCCLNRPLCLLSYSEMDIDEISRIVGESITMIHPFPDGNKRMAYLCTNLFLKINNLNLYKDHIKLCNMIIYYSSNQREKIRN